jgi:uncharacterized protein
LLAPSEVLSVTDHRPWPVPRAPWIMEQSWCDLLFAHWPVPVEVLRPMIPEPLAIHTFEATAYVGVTPFSLSLRPRGLPVMQKFFELNCRTYVEFNGRPGVFFFSLDAGSPLAVWGARTFYFLPYFTAEMSATREGEDIVYRSRRISDGASLHALYRPAGPVRRRIKGSLEHWLTERYCLYTRRGRHLYTADIHHWPWPLQDAECEFAENTIAQSHGIRLPDEQPLLHFSAALDVLIWPLRLVG